LVFPVKNFKKNGQQVQLKFSSFLTSTKKSVLQKQDKADDGQVLEEAYQGKQARSGGNGRPKRGLKSEHRDCGVGGID